MALAIVEAHVVGCLSARTWDGRVRCRWRLDRSENGRPYVDSDNVEFSQPCEVVGVDVPVPGAFTEVEYVWVHPGFRRRGIGTQLLRATARRADTPAEDLPWRLPFKSSEGATLAYRSAPREFWAYC